MRIYIDIFIQSELEGNRIRLRPLPDQEVSSDLHVSCSRSLRTTYPVGTIFKADLQLVRKQNGIRPYLKLRKGWQLRPAMEDEYFRHNLKLQKELK